MLPALLLSLILAAQGTAADPQPLTDREERLRSSSLPCTSGSSRGGLPVVVISSPESPWAVVQLHVRVAGEGIPQELRAHTEALASALADGKVHKARPGARARIAAAHGETRVLVDDDAFVISDGVPAESLDVALSALDGRLRVRRRVIPHEGAPLPRLDGEGRVPLMVRQALAPAHPYAQPLSLEGEAEAAKITALADLVLRRDGVVVVVIGNEPEAKLRARALRRLTTTLPTGAKAFVPLTPTAGARVIEDVKMASGPRGLFSWLWWQTPGMRAGTASERAAYRTLGALVGAEAGEGDAAGWISWHVPLTSPDRAEAEEVRRIERLEAVAAGEISADDVKRASARARSERLRELSSPEALARAIAAAALAGHACALDDELSALSAVTPASVQAAATALIVGGRLAVRGEGPAVGGGS